MIALNSGNDSFLSPSLSASSAMTHNSVTTRRESGRTGHTDHCRHFCICQIGAVVLLHGVLQLFGVNRSVFVFVKQLEGLFQIVVGLQRLVCSTKKNTRNQKVLMIHASASRQPRPEIHQSRFDRCRQDRPCQTTAKVVKHQRKKRFRDTMRASSFLPTFWSSFLNTLASSWRSIEPLESEST